MSTDITIDFAARLIAGLQRKAIVVPSRWALEYVRDTSGQPMSFRRFPWQRHMLDSKAPHNCATKGAQLGVSHMALIRGTCANDLEKRDVLYIMPSMHPQGSDFSKARFDVLVRCSPHLNDIYDRGNIGHKRTSTNNFYIRGGQSRSGGKSIPAGLLIIDEIDEIGKEFVRLVRERMSGQVEKLEWDISTPTIPEHGITKLWDDSSQEHFFFPCPLCAKHIHLDITNLDDPECLEVVGEDPESVELREKSYLKCPSCKGKLDHSEKENFLARAEFVPAVTGKVLRGFHVNQCYSTTVTPGELAADFIRAQHSDIDAQEFWNSKMGRAYSPEGSKVNDAQINSCRAMHRNGVARPVHPIVTMGVDVGSWLHFEVCEWSVGDIVGNDVNTHAVPRVLKAGKVKDFEQLDTLMEEWDVTMCVIDALPETRKAFEFSQRFWGRVKMCHYYHMATGRMLTETAWDGGEPIINCNRTSWLDQSLGRFRQNKIILPIDTPFEYVEHVKAPNRIWKRNDEGNPVVKYVTPDGKADHHAHARNYCEIALPLAVNIPHNYDIDSPLDSD